MTISSLMLNPKTSLSPILFTTLSLLCSLLSQVERVWAQVNVEQNRPQDRSGLHATLDSSLTLIRGNVDLTQLGLSGRAEYVKGVHSPFIQTSVDYGEKSGVAFLSQSFVHARWTAMWWEQLGTELFAQVQDNSFRSLVLRQLYGGGVRRELATSDTGVFAFGVGAMFERELYIQATPAMDAPNQPAPSPRSERLENNLRGTSYLTVKQPFQLSESGAQMSLSITAYYQPRLQAFNDYRVLGDTSLEVKLSESVRLIESLNILYDSAPPLGVKRYDLKSVTSLRLVF